MEDVWNSILELSSQFVIPDWGATVALIPIALFVLVVLYFSWVGWRYATAGPKVRGGRPLKPRPPEGVHMPSGSYAPVLVGVGAFFLFLGLVVGGIWPIVGVIVLALTLLYWGREGLMDYDHLVGAEHRALAIRREPPPGIHIPAPSFRPVLVSTAMMILLFGLVFGGALLVAGLITLVISLLGWLRDAGFEYRAVEVADRTGHLDAGPSPRFPTGTLVAFALIVAIGAGFNAGVIPPKFEAVEAGGSGGAPGEPPPSGGAAPGGPTVQIAASAVKFDKTELEAPADAPFTIEFDNQDAGIQHNVALHEGSPTGPEVFQGEIFPGPGKRQYAVPALAAGTYGFVCTVHPATMSGTLTAG